MIDLGIEASMKYWQGNSIDSIHDSIVAIEEVEKWTVDGDEQVEAELKKFSQAIGKLIDNDTDIATLGIEKNIITMLAHVKFSRMLYIMTLLDESSPGFASTLFLFAEQKSDHDKDIYSIFMKRNTIFEKIRLSSKIFSHDRLNQLTTVLEDYG